MATIKNVQLNTGLTDYARGIKFGGHIADMIFPQIVADSLSGSYWNFGVGDFQVENQGPYALDQPYLEYEWDISADTFQIENYGYVTRVTDLENANAANQLQLARKKLRRGMRYLTTQRELIAKNLCNRKGANGFAAGHQISATSARWSAAATDPRTHVYDAKDIIRSKIGVRGNAIIIPANVLKALSTNPKMREGYQYVREGALTPQAIGLQFEIDPMNIFIGEAIYNSAKKGQNKSMTDIWEDNVIVFYKEDMPEGEDPPEDSGFGGCFKLRGWEMDRVTETQIGNPPGMLYALQAPYQMKVLDYEAGVLIEGAVA